MQAGLLESVDRVPWETVIGAFRVAQIANDEAREPVFLQARAAAQDDRPIGFEEIFVIQRR
jgi:hypothetical protein